MTRWYHNGKKSTRTLPLTQQELQLAAQIGFAPEICETVKHASSKPLEQTTRTTDNGETVPAEGISVPMPSNDVETFINKHQAGLLAQGYRAFWSTRRAPNGLLLGDELVVLKTTDDFNIIELRLTDGANYGVMTDDIIARLTTWEKLCEFEVIGAASDWVALTFVTLPENICAFAEDVYDFCPDSVEQGVGLTTEADDPQMFAAARILCPETSERMKEAMRVEDAELGETMFNAPPHLLALFKRMQSRPQTRSDMGVKLLAYQVQKTRYLFLWWD